MRHPADGGCCRSARPFFASRDSCLKETAGSRDYRRDLRCHPGHTPSSRMTPHCSKPHNASQARHDATPSRQTRRRSANQPHITNAHAPAASGVAGGGGAERSAAAAADGATPPPSSPRSSRSVASSSHTSAGVNPPCAKCKRLSQHPAAPPAAAQPAAGAGGKKRRGRRGVACLVSEPGGRPSVDERPGAVGPPGLRCEVERAHAALRVRGAGWADGRAGPWTIDSSSARRHCAGERAG